MYIASLPVPFSQSEGGLFMSPVSESGGRLQVMGPRGINPRRLCMLYFDRRFCSGLNRPVTRNNVCFFRVAELIRDV